MIKLLIINDYGISGGGTENRIRLLVDELLQRKIFEEIHLITMQGAAKPYNNLIIHECKKSPFLFTLKIIKKYKIDIVQSHNLLALTPAPILAAKILRRPIIFFAHDYWPICGRRSYIKAETATKEKLCEQTNTLKCIDCIGLRATIKQKMWKQIMNLSTLGISASNFLKNIYEQEGILKNKWHIIPPWIDTTKFGKIINTKKENIILFVGSLIEFKGAQIAAKALKHVVQKISDAKLVFIGDLQEKDSKYRQNIENICRTDNTTSNVLFLGKQDWNIIKEWHSKSKVLIFPTICMETFGLAWAEAMASRIPVIASDIGSVTELIDNKGILIKPRDEIELANAIIRVLTNQKLAKKMADEGREYVLQNFDIKKSIQAIIKEYEHFYTNGKCTITND